MDDKVIAIDNRSNNKLTDIIKTFVVGPINRSLILKHKQR